MKDEQAVVAVSRLSKLKQELVALTPEDHLGSGLPIVKKLVDQKTKKPIFVYVKREDLMNKIKLSHYIIKQGDPHALHRNSW